MSAVANSEDALTRLLDAVDNGKLRQVLRLVEVSGQRQVLEPALARLRPRIRRLRPQRPLTLPRLLTVPLEPALAPGTEQGWPFSIERYRLVDWHDEMIEGLDPSIRKVALARIEERTADDHVAVLEAGKLVWPPAAAVLAAGRTSDEIPEAAIARSRAADLLVIAVDLVPILQRLLPPLGGLDADQRETVATLLNLAEGGPSDRPGLLMQILLRSAARPAAMAQSILELAPAGLRPRLRPLLDALLERHRIDLERRVAEAAEVTDRPLNQLADALVQLADVLVGPRRDRAVESRVQSPRPWPCGSRRQPLHSSATPRLSRMSRRRCRRPARQSMSLPSRRGRAKHEGRPGSVAPPDVWRREGRFSRSRTQHSADCSIAARSGMASQRP